MEVIFHIASIIQDFFKGFISGLTPTASVGAVECSYTTSYSVEQLYVYVKYNGASDNDQILCYTGDAVSLSTLIATPSFFEINGVIKPAVKSDTKNYAIKSEGYSTYMNYACREFYNYNMQYNFHPDYTLGICTLKLINGTISIVLPSHILQ